MVQYVVFGQSREQFLRNGVRKVRECVFSKPYENRDVLVERAMDGMFLACLENTHSLTEGRTLLMSEINVRELKTWY